MRSCCLPLPPALPPSLLLLSLFFPSSQTPLSLHLLFLSPVLLFLCTYSPAPTAPPTPQPKQSFSSATSTGKRSCRSFMFITPGLGFPITTHSFVLFNERKEEKWKSQTHNFVVNPVFLSPLACLSTSHSAIYHQDDKGFHFLGGFAYILRVHFSYTSFHICMPFSLLAAVMPCPRFPGMAGSTAQRRY